MDTIGERLKYERERLGLSQTVFAEIGGVQKRAQINYEKDDRSPDAKYLERIAQAGVNVIYVLTGSLNHHAQSKLVRASSKDNPALKEMKLVAPNYQLSEGEEEIEGVEKDIAERRLILEELDNILERIHFTTAHDLLKSTIVELVFNKAMDMNAAEAMLVLFRDEQEWHEELLEKERKKHDKK